MKHCDPHLLVIIKLIISAMLKCTYIISELKISYYSAALVQDLQCIHCIHFSTRKCNYKEIDIYVM